MSAINKRFLFGPGLLLLLVPGALARDLVVEPDQTLMVTPDQASLNLERLVLGDNATIRFADGVSYWDVSARDASIGENVRIDAAGFPGQAGALGGSLTASEKCQDGAAGEAGGDGADGGAGVNLAMQLVVFKLGSLVIDTRGGPGGPGGFGGEGQAAGATGTCEPPAGGAGGDGGRGGRGGDGGNINLRLGAGDSGENSVSALIRRIDFRVEGGEAGPGGKPGKGGAGSEGQFVKRKTLAGNQGWQAGGARGRSGAAGAEGLPGVDGRVMVSEIPFQIVGQDQPDPESESSGTGRQDEIDQLKRQLQELQKRLEALEQ